MDVGTEEAEQKRYFTIDAMSWEDDLLLFFNLKKDLLN